MTGWSALREAVSAFADRRGHAGATVQGVASGVAAFLTRRVGHVIIDGASEQHAQTEHWPHSTGCAVCAKAAKPARPHRPHPPRDGTAAFDVICLTSSGPFMLLAAARAAGKVFVLAEQVRSRSASDLQEAIVDLILKLEHNFALPVIARIHCDAEPGVVARAVQWALGAIVTETGSTTRRATVWPKL